LDIPEGKTGIAHISFLPVLRTVAEPPLMEKRLYVACTLPLRGKEEVCTGFQFPKCGSEGGIRSGVNPLRLLFGHGINRVEKVFSVGRLKRRATFGLHERLERLVEDRSLSFRI
jgi:hypothetical protein